MSRREVEKVKGRKFGVVGAARSGIAVSRLLQSQGANVFVSELEKEKEIDLEVLKRENIPFETGGHSERLFQGIDYLVVSPGVPFDSPIIVKAIAQGIPVISELEVASWFCRAPIIAITGSNGKTTTTALLGAIFSKAGRKHIVAGNIGFPFSDWVKKVDEKNVAILEVSSFQLQGIKDFKPNVSVLLNITPDHLDHHRNFEDYVAAKGRIFENQNENDFIVFNADDPLVNDLVAKCKSGAKKVPFTLEKRLDYGGFLSNGWLICQLNAFKERIFQVDETALPGKHNLYNALAATLAARIFLVEPDAIRKAVRAFPGLEHRLELVREIEGVKFINDSKATNVDAVWYALQSYQEPIILIAGGKDKGGDFSKLANLISYKVKKLILIGEAADKMEKILGRCTETIKAATLQEAVKLAWSVTTKGDVVLLSPACASFDMFRDFEDRGRQFKKLVWAL